MTYFILFALGLALGRLSRENYIAHLEHKLGSVIAHNAAMVTTVQGFDDVPVEPTGGFKVAWRESRIPEASVN